MYLYLHTYAYIYMYIYIHVRNYIGIKYKALGGNNQSFNGTFNVNGSVTITFGGLQVCLYGYVYVFTYSKYLHIH
jgi:hypothetical protein